MSFLIHILINSILSWYFTYLISVLFNAHFEYTAHGSHWDVHDIFSLKRKQKNDSNLIFDMINFVWRWKLVDRGQNFGAWKISVYELWQPGETHPGGEELPLVIFVKYSVKMKSSLLFFVLVLYSKICKVPGKLSLNFDLLNYKITINMVV